MSEWFSQAFFDAFCDQYSLHEPEREAAFARFISLGGLPTTRNEEWRFTSVRPFSALAFSEPALKPAPDALPAALGEIPCAARLVFVNGYFAPSLSSAEPLPEGLSFGVTLPGLSLQEIKTLKHPFAALNVAFARDTVSLRVRSGCVIEQPVHLIFLSSAEHPTLYFPHIDIHIEPNAQARFIESHARIGDAEHPLLTCAMTRAHVAHAGRCEVVKHQADAPHTFHIALTQAELARGSVFDHQNFVLGAHWSRDDIDASIQGEGAEAHLSGLYLTRDHQHIDVHTSIDHAVPNCHSNELYKGVLTEHGEAVFNGKIYVRPDAQKTAAFQSNRNLLLSPDATINTKPQLEIWADDVRCTHGCTVGQLETAPLFYMRSRGIPEDQARALLTYAFAGEVIERVKDEVLRAQFRQYLAHWMGVEFED